VIIIREALTNKGGPDTKGRQCELSERLKRNVDKYE